MPLAEKLEKIPKKTLKTTIWNAVERAKKIADFFEPIIDEKDDTLWQLLWIISENSKELLEKSEEIDEIYNEFIEKFSQIEKELDNFENEIEKNFFIAKNFSKLSGYPVRIKSKIENLWENYTISENIYKKFRDTKTKLDLLKNKIK